MSLHLTSCERADADAPVRDAALIERGAVALHASALPGSRDGCAWEATEWRQKEVYRRHARAVLTATGAVRAVNSHDALVAALQYAIPMMEEAQEALCGDDSVCFSEGDDLLMVALDKARAALALAEGAAP